MPDDYRIRPMVESDLESVLEWRNHPDVRRFMLTQHEITREEHSAWFARASADPARRLLIVEDAAGAIGFVHFSGVAPDGIADWGFYVRPDAPRGSGRQLGIRARGFAFDTLGLRKVCGQALSFNTASIKLHLGLGFRQEGVLRDQYRTDDGYGDLICFGLLSHEWRTQEPR